MLILKLSVIIATPGGGETPLHDEEEGEGYNPEIQQQDQEDDEYNPELPIDEEGPEYNPEISRDMEVRHWVHCSLP